MKKFHTLVLCILMITMMWGCSLDYSEQADEGMFSYAYGKKSAFVTEYRWDGTEEGMTVLIPEEYDGRKIVSVGGTFGRGLPMPFTVDISRGLPKDAKTVDFAEEEKVDETKELNFTLIISKQVEDVETGDDAYIIVEEDGKIIKYEIKISIKHAE